MSRWVVVYEIDKMRFTEDAASLEKKLESMGDEDALDVSLERHEDSVQRLFITERNLVVSKIETLE